GIFALSFGALAYTIYVFGSVPILSGNIEWARNTFAVNSYIQRLLLTLYVAAPIAVAYWLRFRRWTGLLGTMVVGAIAAFFVMASFYFILVIIVVSAVLYRYVAPRLDWRRMAAILLIAVVAKLAVDTFRFIRSGYFVQLTAGQDFPAVLAPFESDYFYLVMNLQVLQHLAEATPSIFPYQDGYYLSYPVRALFESSAAGRGRGKLSDALWQPSEEWFGFNSVTASCFGEPLEDFGLLGVWAWALGFGFCAAAAYARMRRRPSWLMVFIVAQFTLAILVSFFANVFALFDVYWAIAVALGFDQLCRIRAPQAVLAPRPRANLAIPPATV
ncbi:MAG: oligosaccharide repeat unit polymerase, partial [Limisphaerales bacterium]